MPRVADLVDEVFAGCPALTGDTGQDQAKRKCLRRPFYAQPTRPQDVRFAELIFNPWNHRRDRRGRSLRLAAARLQVLPASFPPLSLPPKRRCHDGAIQPDRSSWRAISGTVRGGQLARDLRDARHELPGLEAERDDISAAPCDITDILNQFAKRLHFGSTQFVGCSRRRLSLQGESYGLCDVVYENRLESRVCADQRQDRHKARHGRETVEEIVLRAEYDRWTKDNGLRHEFMRRRLTLGLAAGVTGRRVLKCADRRYVNEARYACFFDCFGDGRAPPATEYRRMSDRHFRSGCRRD